MKPALTRILMCLGSIGWLAAGLANAQSPSLGPAPWPSDQRVPWNGQLAQTDGGPPTQGSGTPAPITPRTTTGPYGTSLPTANSVQAATPGVSQPSVGTTRVEPDVASSNNGLLNNNGPCNGVPVGNGCALCGGGSCYPPEWYVEQGVRVLSRSRPRDIPIGYDFNSSTNLYDELLNTRSASPNISAAWSMTIGHYFARDTEGRDHFLEFSFWGFNNWQDEAALNGYRLSETNASGNKIAEYGSLFSEYIHAQNGLELNGFNRADQQTTYYASFINNAEINGRFTSRGRPDRLVLLPDGNWRRECQPGMYMSYLYGLRFLQLNETFRFHSQGVTDTYDPITGALTDSRTYTGDYDVVAHNNLLGAQIGAELTFRECRWSWGIRSKLGPYLNFAEQVSDISAGTALSPEYVERLAANKNMAAFVGEVGFEATYKFRPHLMGRAAYDFMWITGAALAPEQLQFNVNPVDKLNTNGLVFLQGISLGLEYLW